MCRDDHGGKPLLGLGVESVSFRGFIAQDLEKLGDFNVDSASSGSDCSVSITCNAKLVIFMSQMARCV